MSGLGRKEGNVRVALVEGIPRGVGKEERGKTANEEEEEESVAVDIVLPVRSLELGRRGGICSIQR